MAEATNKPTGSAADFAALNDRIQRLEDKVSESNADARVTALESTVANLSASDVEQNTKINELIAAANAATDTAPPDDKDDRTPAKTKKT